MESDPNYGFLTPARRATLRALATAFVPEIGQASPNQWATLEETLEHAIAQRPAAVQRQLAAFLKLLGVTARFRFGRSLTRTPAPDLSRFLEQLARSPIPMIRRGVWGLRTLVMMGWYTQPDVAAAIGYHASPAGWSAR
jgi:hypothetical protein